jgi:hypothetical protein
MPVIHLEAQVSLDELLAAAGQLTLPDMEQFVARLLALRAQRRAPSLPAEEAELLRAINQGVPAELRDRYEVLIARRRADTLTEEEHQELLRLTDQVEAADAERLSHLASLSRLRGVPLGALLESLGIRAPEGA